MTDIENKNKFLIGYFEEEITGGFENEISYIEEILDIVKREFSKRKYVLGLAMDFLLLSQKASEFDEALNTFRENFSQKELFTSYPLVEKRAGSKANTLSINVNGNQIGIRKFEENVADFFHKADRSEYPSAYVYNTGQWKKYLTLLETCFKLSRNGRYKALSNLIDFGFSAMEKNIYFERSEYRVNIFSEVIRSYERTDPKENGGLTFQAIAFAFFVADRPHLHVIADKVRTGSARQKRIGDIDCYNGLDLEYSVEVKDFEINEKNFERQIGEFIRDCNRKKAQSCVFCAAYNLDEIEALETFETTFLDQDDIQFIVETWDFQKQEKALAAMLHYLAHIEQNPLAVTRLLTFINVIAPSNSWSEFL
ncbi:MAG: hypothetical protein ACPGR2_09560 [Psychrobium sp.]